MLVMRETAWSWRRCGCEEREGVDGGGHDGQCERDRIALKWDGGGGKARSRRVRHVYSPKNLLRLDLDGFRCPARSLEGQSAWHASSYMW